MKFSGMAYSIVTVTDENLFLHFHCTELGYLLYMYVRVMYKAYVVLLWKAGKTLVHGLHWCSKSHAGPRSIVYVYAL